MLNPLPSPIHRYITRSEADADDWYLSWANGFILVRPTAIKELRSRPNGGLGWTRITREKPHCYYRDIGSDRLWVYEQGRGWIIELTHQQDPTVLTYTLGELPLLCPTRKAAAALAELCYPHPPTDYPFSWHSC